MGILARLGSVLMAIMLATGAQAAGGEVSVAADDPAVTGQYAFYPGVLVVHRGDVIRFSAPDNRYVIRSIPGMLPPGATPWWFADTATHEVRLDQAGVYGFAAADYYELGMVGLVVVEDADINLATACAIRHPAAAAERFRKLFKQLFTLEPQVPQAECKPPN